MNAPPLDDHNLASLTDLHRIWGTGRQATGPSASAMRDATAAECIGAQVRWRVVVALLVTVVQLMLTLSAGHVAAGRPVALTTTAFLYLTMTGTFALVVRRRGTASPALVSLVLAGDLAYVFASTVLSTTPAHYERALFGTMVVVHVANYYFGKRQAWRAVGLGVAGYLSIVLAAALRGMPVDAGEELWSLCIAGAGIGLSVLQASDVRRRLRTIVTLFERAEEGDFSQAYDEAADARPDAITRVGRAYNRFRSQLASMVLNDPLTGCLNRRGFDQALAREVARAARAGSELALLAIDLDHFKLINDTHGHLAGDDVLRDMGMLLIQCGRAGDVVGRVGGEEFAILLSDTNGTGAFLFASRLCDTVRSHAFPLVGPERRSLTLTTSIGIVSGAPDGDAGFASLLASRADAALYEAKRSGRDRVRSWSAQSEDAFLEASDEERDLLRRRAAR